MKGNATGPRNPARAAPLAQADELAAHAGSAAALLRILANAHRLQVLCALCDGELAVGGINERVRLSQSALSQHLAKLRRAGLVRTHREGRTVRYALASPAAAHLVGALRDWYRDQA